MFCHTGQPILMDILATFTVNTKIDVHSDATAPTANCCRQFCVTFSQQTRKVNFKGSKLSRVFHATTIAVETTTSKLEMRHPSKLHPINEWRQWIWIPNLVIVEARWTTIQAANTNSDCKQNILNSTMCSAADGGFGLREKHNFSF